MWRPCGVFDTNYDKDQAIIRTQRQWAAVLGGLMAAGLLPYLIGGAILNTCNLILITVISVLGLYILTGMTGQISLGQTAFMAIGAYVMGLMVEHWHLNFWLALPSAMLASGLAGLIFGIPSLRIKGFYLAMATLAAQFIIPWLIVNVRPDLTGGTDTLVIPAPSIGGLVLNTQTRMFYLCLVLAVAGTYYAKNLQRSRIGRAFIAIRDNDLAAESMGVGIFRYKLLSFFICSVYAGLAGALYGIWMRGVSVEHFTLSESIWLLGMLIVGGMSSPAGVWFGAVFIRGLDILVRYIGPFIEPYFSADVGAAVKLGMAPVVFGVVGLLFLIFEPKGLYRIWERFKNYYRLWPFSY